MVIELTSGQLSYLNKVAGSPYCIYDNWNIDDVIYIKSCNLVKDISGPIGFVRYAITFKGLWILYLYCETDLCL